MSWCNGILWSVDGKSITTDKAGDIDFSVKTETNAIPVNIVNIIMGIGIFFVVKKGKDRESG